MTVSRIELRQNHRSRVHSFNSLFSPIEYVVAESVVVIKNLLQTQAADHFEIISQMAKLIDFITVPAARASILWLIGEYGEKVPKIAPDVLRKMAKSFVDEVNHAHTWKITTCSILFIVFVVCHRKTWSNYKYSICR